MATLDWPNDILASHPHGWRLGANDNNIGGWLAVCVYVVLSCLCWREVASQLSSSRAEGRTLPPLFWLMLSIGVTGLGINKQLDFQTLIMTAGRRIAESEGIIRYRPLLEAGFFGIILLAVIFLVAILWNLARRAPKRGRLVLIGTGLMLGFVLLRVADIEHVGGAIIENIPHRWLIAVELAASAFLSVAVWRNARPS